ncbi:ABC transporter permease [Capillimicrobium parvum]|uniref:ABC transporter permease n=1 Tax=Capillimicrobium parvum TaxID=2884022 RepID=UPI00216AC2B9|nr:ABC transporter permease [Capillimicrobium parvum]
MGNFQAVVGNQAVVAIVALAALIPIACNEWDLSVGATAGVSSIYVASAMSSGTPVLVAILLGLGIGLVVGLFNAVVVTRFGVNGIIATLGTATLLAGVTQAKTGGVAIVANIPNSVVSFGSGNWLGIPKAGWLLIVITLGVYYLLNHTPFGRYVYAVGANPDAARLVGLRSNRLIGWSFVAAGVLAGGAGALQVARAGGADPRVGEQFTLPALAAAFLSAAAIQPGRYNVWGTIVAIFFLAALNAGLNLAGSQDYITNFVNGAALIIGVGLAAYLGRKRKGA